MGIPLGTFEFLDNSAGLDTRASPTKVGEAKASSSLNVDYTVDGAARTRYGSSIYNASAQLSSGMRTYAMFDYKKSTGAEVNVYFAGTSIYHNAQVPSAAVTGLQPMLPDFEFITTTDDEYLVFGNGSDTNRKFNGTTWTSLSFDGPTGFSLADGGTGTLPVGEYSYYASFARTVGGIIVQESAITEEPVKITIAASHKITVTLPISTDSQVNARVIYRKAPGSITHYRLYTVQDNTTSSYSDDVAADGTIVYETDNEAPPKSAIFENFGERIYYVDAANPTDLYESKANRPWNAPAETLVILDGGIRCLKRTYGALVIGTDKSIYVLLGPLSENEPIKIVSGVGILNNNCACGDSILYLLATNKKFYKIFPTSLANNEFRLSDPLSDEVDTVFRGISASGEDLIFMEYYTKSNVAKVMISCPTGSSATNNTLVIFNEQQAIAKQSTCWQVWNNINAACMKTFSLYGERVLLSGDYNGFLWQLDDSAHYGDGGEINGTATAATSTTLTDSTQAYTVNRFVGVNITIVSGTGSGQTRTITSNTATQVTVATWTTTPSTDSVFTIGGYDSYHFTNWKSLTGSYDALKQLWFIWANLNSQGSYSISVYLEYDFDESIANATTLSWNVGSTSTIWGAFIWGASVWGSISVYQSRKRQFKRFRSIRIGFRSQKAGQPFQLNSLSLYAQDKRLFSGSAA